MRTKILILNLLIPFLILAQTEVNPIKIMPLEDEISKATVSIEVSTSSNERSTSTFEFKERIEKIRERIRNLKSQNISKLKEEIDRLKEEQKFIREEISKKTEELRIQREKIIEEMKSNIESKFSSLKDKQKEAALRIFAKMNELNKIFTDNYLRYILQIEEKIVRAEEKIKEMKSRGIVTGDAEMKILEAQNKINELREKIISQQNKIYEFEDFNTSTTSTPPNKYFAQKVKEFRENHKELRELIVKEGRRVVKDILDEIKKALTPTTTPSQ